MAKKPTHYRITVNRPVEAGGTRLRPGARYTVKAAVHDALRKDMSEAIVEATAVAME